MNVTPQSASPGADIAFPLARVLFGVVFTFAGLNHFLNLDHTIDYAEMRGLPAPRLNVVVSGGTLVLDGLGITFGASLALAADAVAVFLIVETPVLHDFWTIPEDQWESEVTGFLKNLVMFDGALIFLALSGTTWSYVIGLALF